MLGEKENLLQRDIGRGGEEQMADSSFKTCRREIGGSGVVHYYPKKGGRFGKHTP